MYLRSKKRIEELVSTEDTEIYANSESLTSIEEVLEGETEGSNPKSVMDGIRRDSDRVAMARASRSLEERYARTACKASNSLGVSATQGLKRWCSHSSLKLTSFLFIWLVQQLRMNLTT